MTIMHTSCAPFVCRIGHLLFSSYASRGNNGHYWINTTQGLHEVKCKMGLQCGGVEGGWMQVVDVNMAHDSSCPGAWRMITSPRRLCIGGLNAGCDSAIFYTKSVCFSTSVVRQNLIRKELRMHLMIN